MTSSDCVLGQQHFDEYSLQKIARKTGFDLIIKYGNIMANAGTFPYSIHIYGPDKIYCPFVSVLLRVYGLHTKTCGYSVR